MTRTGSTPSGHTHLRMGVWPVWPQLTWWTLLAVLLINLPGTQAQPIRSVPVPATCQSESQGFLLGTTDGSGGVLRRFDLRGSSTVLQRFPAPVAQLLCILDHTVEKGQVAAMTTDGRVWLGVPGRMQSVARARGAAPYLLFKTADPRPACDWRNYPERADCPTHLLVISSQRSLLGQPGVRVEIMTPRPRFLGRTVKSWHLPDVQPARIDFNGLLGQRDGHVVLISWWSGHEYDRSLGPGPDDAGALHAVAEAKLYTGIDRTTGRAWLVQSDSIDTEAPRLDVTLPGPAIADLPILIPDNYDVPEVANVFGRERATGRWRGWQVQLRGGKIRALTLPAVQGTVLTILPSPASGLRLVVRTGDAYRLQPWAP